eukprot:c33647_g1_i1.p1 GENE.c33647_g1_i1~~c33647_g1_i1.p1  ORF type:complete len:329 (+),score=104.91 c33647_g1_i1:88-1074(+)
MKREFLIVFLIFLAGTAEMQMISSAITPNKNIAVDPTAAAIQAILGQVQALDQNGGIEKLLQAFSSSIQKGSLLDQVLLDVGSEAGETATPTTSITPSPSVTPSPSASLGYIPPNEKPTYNKVLVGAAFAMLWTRLFGDIPFENIASHTHAVSKQTIGVVKSHLSNIFELASSGLWFEGFMLHLHDILSGKEMFEIKTVAPLLLQLFAAGFLILKPMTTLMKFEVTKATEGEMKYTNFFGILFFHLANMILAAFTIQNGIDTKATGVKKYSLLGAVSLIVIGTAFLFAAEKHVKTETNLEHRRGTVFNYIGSILLFGGYVINLVADYV